MKRVKTLLTLSVVAALMTAGAPLQGHALGEDPILVGEDAVGDAALSNDPTTQPLGVDLTHLYIHRPDFDKDELEFIWKVTQLDVPPPNEIVRYQWTALVDGKEYFVQGKMSDVVSMANSDEPSTTVPESAGRLQGSFRLRGNCEALATTNFCHHIMWLTGTFDLDRDEVRITVPLNSPLAPHFKPGATILAGSIAEAGFQAIITQGGTTTDTADQFEDYVIPG